MPGVTDLRTAASSAIVGALGETGATYQDEDVGTLNDVRVIFRRTHHEQDEFGSRIQVNGAKAWIERRHFGDTPPRPRGTLTRSNGETFEVRDYAPAGGGLWELDLG